MSNILEYKGYYAKIEYDANDFKLFGKVQDVADTILFEIENPSEAVSVYKEVIDDYLEACEELGKEPCKPFSGSFNVRISPELHKKATQKARLQDISLNRYVENAIDKYVLCDSKLHTVFNINIVCDELKKTHEALWDKVPKVSVLDKNLQFQRHPCQ